MFWGVLVACKRLLTVFREINPTDNSLSYLTRDSMKNVWHLWFQKRRCFNRNPLESVWQVYTFTISEREMYPCFHVICDNIILYTQPLQEFTTVTTSWSCLSLICIAFARRLSKYAFVWCRSQLFVTISSIITGLRAVHTCNAS